MSLQDDSAALERQFEEAARWRRRTTRLVSAGAVGLLLLPFIYYGVQCYRFEQKLVSERKAAQLTPAERSEAGELLTQAERTLAEAQAGWRANMTSAAMEGAIETAEPCPYPMQAPTPSAAHNYVLYGSIDGNYFGAVYFT